jgi:hypothetical protein
MKKASESLPAPRDPEDVSPSLRDVAAYLRGVADATAALSQRAAAAEIHPQDVQPIVVAKKHVVIKTGETSSSTRETLLDASPVSSRHTVPYDGLDRGSDTVPVRQTMGYPLDRATEHFEQSWNIDDSWDAPPFVDERPSDVRLKVGQLSPEWYELVNARVG